jgi:hypothetical protein
MASTLIRTQTRNKAPFELRLSSWGIMAWGTPPRSSRLQLGEGSQEGIPVPSRQAAQGHNVNLTLGIVLDLLLPSKAVLARMERFLGAGL